MRARTERHLLMRNDPAGAGHFGAPRGERKHNGVDYEVEPGSLVLSPVRGFVTKIGFPYKPGDGEVYHYVEITDVAGMRHRLFYVEPSSVEVGDAVRLNDVVGEAQDITLRYPTTDMRPHIHYEIKTPDDEFTDPSVYRA